MKKPLLRSLCLSLTALLTGSMLAPLTAFAKGTVTVSSTSVTEISLAESYSDFTYNGSPADRIYIEKNLCPEPYFDAVRVGDTISVEIQVGAAGTYQVCLVTGWADNVAGGNFVFLLDGEEIGTLKNQVPGAGWRSWKDTTPAEIDLPAGTHTFTILSKADGPNIQGLKFAPKDVKISEVTGYADAYSGNQGQALEIMSTFAVQFNSPLPVKEVNAACPSYNNNKGTLRLSLYRWADSYEATLRGTPVASRTWVDFNDNATLTVTCDSYADAGEYLFYIENQSVQGEQVGIWTAKETVENIRTFRDDQVIDQAPMVKVKYIGEDFSFLPISNLSKNDVDPTPSDLYPAGDFARREMAYNDQYAVRFNADDAFTGAEVYIPAAPSDASGNTLDLSLYAWKGSYQMTVAEAPAAFASVSGIQRGTWAKLSADLPAGEYLFLIRHGVTNMQVCTVEKASDTAELYVNGSACGLSLVARLCGFKGQFTPLDAALPTEFINPGVWTAVDGLGRTVTDAASAGPRRDKYVGIFYHTWHSSHYRNKIINGTLTIEQYPEARNDYKHPAWNGITTVFWDEPVWGYYNNGVDRWVLRNQAELLADADIDVVIFDNTNGTENYMAAINELLEVWSEARNDGVKAPGISAMLNMFQYDQAATQIRELYDNIYSKGLYKDLWFLWEGKPLMVGSPSGLDLHDAHDKEIYEFFSWRPINPCYTQDYRQIIENGRITTSWSPDSSLLRKYTFWKWISVYPQQSMLNVKDKSIVEEMSVSVAQNWSGAKGLTAMNAGYDDQYGRAYSIETGCLVPTEDAILWGYNFKDQFEYALSVDPSFIYITGWNEWVAGRYEEMWGTTNALPDNATAGFSRDIEPSNGVLKDHYYYQMVSFIRQYKGVEPQAPANIAKTIDLHAGAEQWADIQPEFRTYADNTGVRNADGYQGYHYDNTTGRNDIVSSKVTYDENNVYFMVTTKDALTPASDPLWMRLFIGVEGSDAPAWETFGYVVNRTSPGEKALLEKSTGGWSWESAAEIDYTVTGNLLQIAVPRKALGIDGRDFVINFKWADNNLADGDLMSVYNDGDTAPCGRFRFTYSSVIPAPETLPETDDETAGPETVVTEAPESEAGTETSGKGCSSALAAAAPAVLFAAGAAMTKRGRKKEKL